MVVNQGLHWLHFYGLARNTSAQAIRRWIRYEDWLREVYEHALANNVTVLLYKTTNFFCDQIMIYGWFQEANRLYQARDPATLRHCQQLVQEGVRQEGSRDLSSDPPAASSRAIADYCVNGTVNSRGANHLFESTPVCLCEESESKVNMHVGIYNDHDLQSCHHCGADDGLHYHNTDLMRIRLLANQLACVSSKLLI